MKTKKKADYIQALTIFQEEDSIPKVILIGWKLVLINIIYKLFSTISLFILNDISIKILLKLIKNIFSIKKYK